jgi:hypothetical protein
LTRSVGYAPSHRHPSLLWVAVGIGAQDGFVPPSGTSPDDIIAVKLWRIAVATHTRIGFEAVDHVKFPSMLEHTPPFAVSGLDESLNAALDDRYEWGKAGDVIVVRPVGARLDPKNPFNRPIRNIQVQNALPNGVLGGVRDFIYTNTFTVDPRPKGNEPLVSFQLQSRTVIDLLNALMTASDQMMWVGAYRLIGQSHRFPKWDLTLDLRNAEHLTGYTGSYPMKTR